MKASCAGCPYPAHCAEMDECILGAAQGVHDGCGGMLRMGYGGAAGVGIGAYLFCDKCSVVTHKWPDQEMR